MGLGVRGGGEDGAIHRVAMLIEDVEQLNMLI